MKRQAFVNGEYVDREKAKIDVEDTGLIRGYGVFDYLRTFGGKPFLLDEHLTRLFNSAKEINLSIPYSKSEVEKIINKVLEINNDENSGVRTVVTGGRSKNGIFPEGKPGFVVVSKKIEPDTKIVDQGVSVITCEHQREFSQAKTLNYLKLISHQREIEGSDAYTALFVSNGFVLEGGTSNVFIIKDKKIITPEENILKGITRGLIIKLAEENGYQVEERDVEVEELLESREVFLTSTTRGVIPVVQIDDREIGDRRPGKQTKKLIDIYQGYVEEFKTRD